MDEGGGRGDATRAFLAGQNAYANIDGNSSGSGDSSPPTDSSVTVVLVLSTMVALCGSFTNGLASGYSSAAESGILDDLQLSLAGYSLFGSILTIGAMFGALLSGKTADWLGRRGVLWSSDILCIAGWLGIVFSKGAWLLDLGRFSVGLGIGIISYTVPVYVSEIAPKDIRGAFAFANQLLICCGLSLMFFVGNVVSWRILAIIGTIPSFVQLVGLFFIPESPRWLAKNGDDKEAKSALQRLRGGHTDISEEAAEIQEFAEASKHDSEARFLDLFQRKYAHAVIVVVGLMFMTQFGGINGVAFYASSIFKSAGFSESIGTTAVAITQIPACLLGVLLLDKSGRRPLLMASTSAMCIGSFIVGFAFLMQDFHLLKHLSPALVLVGLLAYSIGVAVGTGGIPWVIMSELFAVNVKGSAGSLATLVNWSSSWVVSYAFNYTFEWSSAGTFFLYSVVCGVTVLFVAKLVPETKGRTLEEIQASITGFFL